MLSLSVRTASTAGISAIGETLVFDFSSDVTSGNSILNYGVALSGFLLNYETNSSDWAEQMGMLTVNFAPNLIGTRLYVMANAIMTDYDGDAGHAPSTDNSNPACTIQATAIALIGSSIESPAVVLGNLYDIGNGQSSSPIKIGQDYFYGAFLSGFSLAASGGSAGSVSSLSFAVTDNVTQDELTVTASTSVGSMGTVGSVDALLFAAPTTLTGFQIVPVNIEFQAPDGNQGMTGSFLAEFDPPDGLKILNCGLLLQNVNIIYGDNAQFQVLSSSGFTFPPIHNNVAGLYTLNIYNPDFGARTYISSNSSVIMYAIAQFG